MKKVNLEDKFRNMKLLSAVTSVQFAGNTTKNGSSVRDEDEDWHSTKIGYDGRNKKGA